MSHYYLGREFTGATGSNYSRVFKGKQMASRETVRCKKEKERERESEGEREKERTRLTKISR